MWQRIKRRLRKYGEFMKKKILIIFVIVFVLILSILLFAKCLKDNRAKADIDVKFMSDYGNLTIGMLNKSIQTEEIAIHKYDTENTNRKE